MRTTYRTHAGNRAYWQSRWDGTPADSGDLNLERYPGRFAEHVMARASGPVLEAGCGAGRVLRHYHDKGVEIIGMDFIHSAIAKVHQEDPNVPLLVGDISKLAFAGESFGAVLAFGLYHNLEHGAAEALLETRRVLRRGGIICATVRADNFQNRVVDWIYDRRLTEANRSFHKVNFARNEFVQLLENSGFRVSEVHYVANMPFLYQFPFLRHRTHRIFDEQKGRAEGYRLSFLGSALQGLLTRLSPSNFCNTIVAIAETC